MNVSAAQSNCVGVGQVKASAPKGGTSSTEKKRLDLL